MKLRIVFILAIKNLLGRKLRTFLTIGGISIGIAAIVFLLSLAYGLQKVITSGLADMQSYKIVDVNPVKSSTSRLNNETIEKIRGFSNVRKVEGITNFAGQSKSDKGAFTETVIYGASREYLSLASIKPIKGGYYDDSKKEILVNRSLLKLVGLNEDNALGKSVNFNLEINKSKAPKQKEEINNKKNRN